MKIKKYIKIYLKKSKLNITSILRAEKYQKFFSEFVEICIRMQNFFKN